MSHHANPSISIFPFLVPLEITMFSPHIFSVSHGQSMVSNVLFHGWDVIRDLIPCQIVGISKFK